MGISCCSSSPPMKERKDKKMKNILIGVVSLLVGFFGGIYFEHQASQGDVEEMVQITQEACDMRLKTLKFTCKK